MTMDEKRILWGLVKENPYASVKELYKEAIKFIDVSLSTVRKYKRIILEDIREGEKNE